MGSNGRGQSPSERYTRALNRLAKWRTILAGWQLGTRSDRDPECQAVRDHRELSLILRVEVTALTRLLVEKGICTREELYAAVAEEADLLSQEFEHRFPGARATEAGIQIDLTRAVEWLSKFPQ